MSFSFSQPTPVRSPLPTMSFSFSQPTPVRSPLQNNNLPANLDLNLEPQPQKKHQQDACTTSLFQPTTSKIESSNNDDSSPFDTMLEIGGAKEMPFVLVPANLKICRQDGFQGIMDMTQLTFLLCNVFCDSFLLNSLVEIDATTTVSRNLKLVLYTTWKESFKTGLLKNSPMNINIKPDGLTLRADNDNQEEIDFTVIKLPESSFSFGSSANIETRYLATRGTITGAHLAFCCYFMPSKRILTVSYCNRWLSENVLANYLSETIDNINAMSIIKLLRHLDCNQVLDNKKATIYLIERHLQKISMQCSNLTKHLMPIKRKDKIIIDKTLDLFSF